MLIAIQIYATNMIDLPGQVTSFNRLPRGSFGCNPVAGLTVNASTNSSSACSQSLHRNGYHAHKIRMINVLNCCIELSQWKYSYKNCAGTDW